MVISPFGKIAMAKQRILKQTSNNPIVTVYRVVNGNPKTNLERVVDLQGGIEKIIGAYDVVVIKPNVQWWNQGAPNIQALKALVDLIMERPGGFSGEVVIAENCHRGEQPWDSMSSGWKPIFERNADIEGINNYQNITEHLKNAYGDKYLTVHWINVDSGGQRVYGPVDGSGYVFCDGTGGVPKLAFGNGADGNDFREVVMTYPVFKTDKGTVVDLKNGIWEKGSYTGQPLRFINFAALNHHSTYCGFTSAIKNYLGVSDLSGGPDPINGGKLTEKYYNFHSFPFNKWAPGPTPGMIGAEIGEYLTTIRRADLNIVSAEWIGLASRVDKPVVRTRAVLASTDPVALDYHSSKYILHANSGIKVHNPDDKRSPAHQYLKACADHGGGVFDETKVGIKSYDFNTERFQKDDELVIQGEKKWGRDYKTLMKYFYLRYFWYG